MLGINPYTIAELARTAIAQDFLYGEASYLDSTQITLAHITVSIAYIRKKEIVNYYDPQNRRRNMVEFTAQCTMH